MWPLSYEKFMNMIIYHLIILLLHELVFCSLFLYPGNKSHLVNMNYSFNSQFDILIQLKNWFWNYFCSKGKLRTLNFSSDFSLSLWFQFSAMNVQCFQIGFFFFNFYFYFLSWISHTIQVWELPSLEFLCFILCDAKLFA